MVPTIGPLLMLRSPFPHSSTVVRAPLVVFASFEDGKVTHIADGKKGALAGTGLSRLNMQDLKPLARPIGCDELNSGVPKRLQDTSETSTDGRRHSSAENLSGHSSTALWNSMHL